MTIKPDRQDYVAVARQYGEPPADAPESVQAEYYRLAQAVKLIRLNPECATLEELVDAKKRGVARTA